jgi:hypothetical protein
MKRIIALLVGLWTLNSGLWTVPATAATVTGTLVDIGLHPFDTKIVFTPTNEVQVSSAGLSAGPPKVLDTTNGAFSIVLDAGDYAVSLPLISLRRPFMISVTDTNGTLNITNIMSSLPSYPANNPDFTVRATAWDNGPGILNTKIRAAGSLTKTLSTNAGSVSLILSNGAAWALDNESVHIGLDGACGFGLLGVPFHINASGNFDRLSIGDEGEHLFNADGAFSLANGNVTGDTGGNLTARAFTTSGDIEITDTTKGVILKSAEGARYRIKVADDGTLSTEAAP